MDRDKMKAEKGPVSRFMEHHFRHFNAATVIDAARAYEELIDGGGKMMLTLAGAMSTAELGRSLAEMIRQEKVDIICCTGANLEEDIFNLVAHSHYKRVPNYRELTADDENALLGQHYNRVTDTCIPEEEAMRRIEGGIFRLWERAHKDKARYFPHEFIYELVRSGELESSYDIDPGDSWVVAACERDLPLVVPGWEDSTLGNFFAAHCIQKELDPNVIRGGIEYMVELSSWYSKNAGDSHHRGIGFFQIGGGIAGDFPICVVPMLHQDLGKTEVPRWSYFCQISDSTTSFGSYSGAVPNEKITWGKLDVDTPKFIIESDASIVAPLMFAWILGL